MILRTAIFLALATALLATPPAGAQSLEALEREIVGLFDRASPSVVAISLRRDNGARIGDRMRSGDGAGSGIVWDTAGHIVTNAHVLEGLSEGRVLSVTFDGVKRLPASVVGMAPEVDLAVIRLDRADEPLRPIARGTSTDLRVGQLVFAIGNPFGLDRSLSQGIISALDRKLPTVAGREVAGVIQTDAAINPGNSGGPLLDARGRLIGVNTAIIRPAQGICFAIASNTARWVTAWLIKDGRIRRSYIGLGGQNVPLIRKVARYHHLDQDTGVLVANLEANSPAMRAGLREGDVVVALDGAPTPAVDALHRLLTGDRIGERAIITFLRGVELRRHAIIPLEMPSRP